MKFAPRNRTTARFEGLQTALTSIALTVALVVASLVCPSAEAAIVHTTEDSSLELAAGASTDDNPDIDRTITVTRVAERVLLDTANDPIAIAVPDRDRCHLASGSGPSSVTCDLTDIQRVIVLSGDGDDQITVNGDLVTLLCGGPGNDRIVGGAGPDYVSGAAGTDALSGGGGDDVLRADRDLTHLADFGATCAGSEADLPSGNTLDGGEGRDVLIGDDGSDTLLGGAGDDAEFGRSGDDHLYGDEGDDLLVGGEGEDRLDGGPGADKLSGGAGSDRLIGAAGNDTLGMPAVIVVDGQTEASFEDGDDLMDGGPDDDTLFGGPGDQTLTFPTSVEPAGGGAQPNGADTFRGGDGRDRVSYVNRDVGVSVTLNGRRDDGAPGERDSVARDVEDVTGGNGPDIIRTGSTSNRLDGGPGPDELSGGAGDDFLIGGVDDAEDTLVGGSGNDSLDGGPGNDKLSGGPGDDLIDGGAGSDTLLGRDGADRLIGGPGADVLRGGSGDDLLSGDADPDALIGGPGNDLITARDAIRDYPISCDLGTDLAILDPIDGVVDAGACEQLDNGTQTQPRPGKVFVKPVRCARSAERVRIRVPPVRYGLRLGEGDALLLKTGFRRRAAPTVDASDCSVRLTATTRRGRTARADLEGNAVRLRQERSSARTFTTVLSPRRRRCAGSARVLGPGSSRVRLRTGGSTGHWEVSGRYSVAASRGTDWTTIETCRRTITRVHRGRVRVFDRVLRRVAIASPGRPYVARAP